jgi:hypothetical protein
VGRRRATTRPSQRPCFAVWGWHPSFTLHLIASLVAAIMSVKVVLLITIENTSIRHIAAVPSTYIGCLPSLDVVHVVVGYCLAPYLSQKPFLAHFPHCFLLNYPPPTPLPPLTSRSLLCATPTCMLPAAITPPSYHRPDYFPRCQPPPANHDFNKKHPHPAASTC